MVHLVKRYYRLLLVLILALTFFTRIYHLHLPESYIFDEVYHAVTAKLIARNDPRAYEWWNPPVEANTAVDWLHPPYAKYTQAVSIKIFGENTFGWRFSSVIFGVLVVAVVYKITDQAFKSKPMALTAALLTSLDGLLFVQSRIAMNDIHVTFFILLAFLMYLYYRQSERDPKWLVATGLSAGLAAGTKWSGVFILGVVGLAEAIYLLQTLWQQFTHAKLDLGRWLGRVGLTAVCLVGLPIILYLASYSHMFIQGKDFTHLRELHKQIWWYQTNLTATHGYQSRPWQWFLNARPVWYSVTYDQPGKIGNIYAFGNPLLSWLGGLAVVLTIGYLLWSRGKKSSVAVSLGLVLASYLMVWVPWQFSPRIMFYYHYTPAIPFMCILLAYWLRVAWRKNHEWLVYAVLAAVALAFVIWYPHWTNLPVPVEFANRIYFAFSTWK